MGDMATTRLPNDMVTAIGAVVETTVHEVVLGRAGKNGKGGDRKKGQGGEEKVSAGNHAEDSTPTASGCKGA